ncbi:unnamed protein product, partial [Linum tenue]
NIFVKKNLLSWKRGNETPDQIVSPSSSPYSGHVFPLPFSSFSLLLLPSATGKENFLKIQTETKPVQTDKPNREQANVHPRTLAARTRALANESRRSLLLVLSPALSHSVRRKVTSAICLLSHPHIFHFPLLSASPSLSNIRANHHFSRLSASLSSSFIRIAFSLQFAGEGLDLSEV